MEEGGKGLKLNLKCCEIEEYEEMKVPHRAPRDFLGLEYSNIWARKLGLSMLTGFLNKQWRVLCFAE